MNDDYLTFEEKELSKALNQAMTELAILKSVILCGEPWTPTLEESYVLMKAQANKVMELVNYVRQPITNAESSSESNT